MGWLGVAAAGWAVAEVAGWTAGWVVAEVAGWAAAVARGGLRRSQRRPGRRLRAREFQPAG